jgi:hypothetical protein
MEKRLTGLHLEGGPGRWVEAFWRREGGKERSAFLRWEYDANADWWKPVELRVNNPTRRGLAEIPLFVIEQAVNAAEVILDMLANPGDEAPTNLRAAFAERRNAARKRRPLRRPSTRALSDDFYRDVAAAYRDAIVRGLPPGKTIAEDTGAPTGTVNRWIAKAREKEYLPPSEPGKVSF